MAGEYDFLAWIAARQKPAPLVRTGIGDDLAVLNWPDLQLLAVGVDQVLDGVHFDSAIHPPRLIGRKAMNRNLSDCAAMAVLPAAALATVALPKGRDLAYAKEIYLGMEESAGIHDCLIVGGDTATWDGKLVVTVSIFGRSAGIEPITRRTARPGDEIFVSGKLGGSLLGRHLTFEPRVKLARELAATVFPSAMIDLSDGLSRDLANLCKMSRVGAIVAAAAVPIHADAIAMSQDGRSPLDHALHDGEDYELLWTAAARHPAAHRIGVITAEREILLRDKNGLIPLKPAGWEYQL